MRHQFFERMQRAIGNKQQLVTHIDGDANDFDL